jgi:uncharacterized protein YdcH (DUF465 family)
MKDTEVISILRSESDEYKKLEEEHKRLELTLEEITKKKHLTSDEEVQKKQIQKQKLQSKDRMAELVRAKR